MHGRRTPNIGNRVNRVEGSSGCPGPAAPPAVASINLEKSVSVDGGTTYEDADTPPGPTLLFPTNPRFKYVVTNSGTVPLNPPVTLSDPDLHLAITLSESAFGVGATLSYELEGSFAAGQQMNEATATARHGGTPVSDSDPAYYFGVIGAPVIAGLLASIALEEAAIAHLVNAEAEKVQRLAATMPTPSTFEEGMEMQKILLAVANMATLKDLILQEKVKRVLSITF